MKCCYLAMPILVLFACTCLMAQSMDGGDGEPATERTEAKEEVRFLPPFVEPPAKTDAPLVAAEVAAEAKNGSPAAPTSGPPAPASVVVGAVPPTSFVPQPSQREMWVTG